MIRVAETDADLDLWARIRSAASPRERLVRPLRSPDRLYLRAGESGCARAGRSDLQDHTSIAVYVEPAARGYGVGAALFGRCLAHARELGPGRLFATVDELSEPGRAFVGARGFLAQARGALSG